MGVGGQLAHIYNSYRASRIKYLSGYLPSTITVRGYCEESKNSAKTRRGVEEKAPTTAEEFERMAEAKARQGAASQIVEKAQGGFQEAIMGEPKVETVKERYKKPLGNGNYHRTRDDDTQALAPK